MTLNVVNDLVRCKCSVCRLLSTAWRACCAWPSSSTKSRQGHQLQGQGRCYLKTRLKVTVLGLSQIFKVKVKVMLLYKNKTWGQGIRLVAIFKVKVFVVIQVTLYGYSWCQGHSFKLVIVFKVKVAVAVERTSSSAPWPHSFVVVGGTKPESFEGPSTAAGRRITHAGCPQSVLYVVRGCLQPCPPASVVWIGRSSGQTRSAWRQRWLFSRLLCRWLRSSGYWERYSWLKVTNSEPESEK